MSEIRDTIVRAEPYLTGAKRRWRAKVLERRIRRVLREGNYTAPPQRVTVAWPRSSESTI